MTGAPANIDEAFLAIAAAQPGRAAVVADDLTLSYGNLARVVRAYALSMHERGIDSGDVVTLDTSDTIVAVAVCLAAAHLGAVYVPYGPDLFPARGFDVTHVLRSSERPQVPDQPATLIDLSWSPKHRAMPESLPDWTSGRDPQDRSWIMPSSGTTGRAKYVALTEAQVAARVAAVASEFPGTDRRCLVLFPPGSRPFVVRAMAALTSRQTLIDTRSLRFLQEAGTDVVFASPHQIRQFLGGTVLRPRLPLLQISGARLARDFLLDCLRSFEAVEDVYGTNETIKAQIVRHEAGPGGVTATRLTQEAIIEVVDADGAPVPAGEAGTVRIRSPHLAAGYLGDADASRRHFRSGWFHPGDTGRIGPDGILMLEGRDGDVVNLAGEKVRLSDLEAVLLALPVVREAVCLPDPVSGDVLAAAVQLTGDLDRSAAARACWDGMAAALGPGLAPGWLLVVPDFARAADGSIRRGLVRDRLAEAMRSGAPEGTQLFEFEVKVDV